MTEYTHACMKCSTQYKDTDVDDYYCLSCYTETKKIAKEVDKKIGGRVSKKPIKSSLQIFDEMRKNKGIRGFVNIKDLL